MDLEGSNLLSNMSNVLNSSKDRMKDKKLKLNGRSSHDQFESFRLESDMKREQAKALELGTVSRNWTLAIAVPGSLLNNAPSLEMKTYIVGQVARAAAIFCVDEIIVYHDGARENQLGHPTSHRDRNPESSVMLMSRILQYTECPQYLRSHFFPIHPDLKFVGLINPLATPHHLQQSTKCLYREGVVATKELKESKSKKIIREPHTYVNVGLKRNAIVYGDIADHNQRITVKFRNLDKDMDEEQEGDAVSSHAPRTSHGLYWGYDVRIAEDFNAIFRQSPHTDGYDLTIGIGSEGKAAEKVDFPYFEHAIVVFPGVRKIERLLEEDGKLEVKDPLNFFDAYVNPFSPLNTGYVRTEESLLVGLSVLRPKINAAATSSQNQ